MWREAGVAGTTPVRRRAPLHNGAARGAMTAPHARK